MSRITEVFGNRLFNDKVMRDALPKSVYNELQMTINEGKKLSGDIADIVANAMKDWALSEGATHYTHWFQPMTGKTAEKHDSFLNFTGEGTAIEEFSGKALVMGEPDASSFPNGGLRATFEARGYTTWDCTSPAFLKETSGILTLCIPTAFCSYTGQALDTKTPLLKSMECVDYAARRVLKFFGKSDIRVLTTVGAEQEYFLIDKRLYQERKDLIYTGRTLFGASAPKGQELDDHYFGSIKERVAAFMKDIDIELWKLGIAAKTKHNEVAPAQHELASIFTTCNISVDQNQLVMDMLEKVANRHELVCLLHEKPFAGINGSGKHNNWALSTSDGSNLLEPGETPHENTQFLVFLSAIIKAVDKYPELLRISCSSMSNDKRLGGHEAPPAIISIFLGEQLDDILHQIERGELVSSKGRGKLKTGVITLPELYKDVTDRNRTSPFAFTGNKFEFRMPGSLQSIAGPNIVLNTIVADVLNEFADKFENCDDLAVSIKEVVTEVITDHRRVIFNGNGYSEEWIKEAELRGLPNLPTTIDALPHYISDKAIDVFSRNNIFTKEELLSRYEIMVEDYTKKYMIEAKTMLYITRKQILPSSISYLNEVADTVVKIKAVAPNVITSSQVQLIEKLNGLINEASKFADELEISLTKVNELEGLLEQAIFCKDTLNTLMESLRKPCDLLETSVSRKLWPFPTYGDLLFRI